MRGTCIVNCAFRNRLYPLVLIVLGPKLALLSAELVVSPITLLVEAICIFSQICVEIS